MELIAIVEGRVQPGKRIGRRLGVPTANLPYPKDGIRPPDGIYVAQVAFPEEGGRLEEAVLSQGFHPTLPDGPPTLEVFLLNSHEDLYDKLIQVRYLLFIRPEQKFDSTAEMMERIREDVRISREWFEMQGG